MGFGVDTDLAALRASHLTGFVRVALADVIAMPFRSAAFGAVVASGVLHHLPDWTEALGEIARVLEPDGRLLVLDMSPLSDDDFREMNRQMTASGRAREPRNGVLEQELDAALRASGLKRVGSEAAGSWTSATPPWTDRLFSGSAWLHHAVRRW